MELKWALFTGLAQGCIKGRKSSIFWELQFSTKNQNNTWLLRNHLLQ